MYGWVQPILYNYPLPTFSTVTSGGGWGECHIMNRIWLNSPGVRLCIINNQHQSAADPFSQNEETVYLIYLQYCSMLMLSSLPLESIICGALLLCSISLSRVYVQYMCFRQGREINGILPVDCITVCVFTDTWYASIRVLKSYVQHFEKTAMQFPDLWIAMILHKRGKPPVFISNGSSNTHSCFWFDQAQLTLWN